MRLKIIQIIIYCSVLFVLFLAACEDSPEPKSQENQIIQNDKNDDARLLSLTIAGKAVALGAPGATLAEAVAAELKLRFEEASDISPVIVTKSGKAGAVYGKMKHGEPEPVLVKSGAIDLENGDYFVVRVKAEDDSVLYYIVAVTVSKPLGPFQSKYLTFSDEIPVMRINTEGGAAIRGTSDSDYVNAVISIENSKQSNINNWAVTIRGRGNSTWGMPKKPYRIRGVSRNNLFGRERVRNWALLANYADKSLMRNYVAFLLGRSLSSDYISNVIFTELYLNGSYDGLYCLQDHQESGPSRVNVEGFTKDASGNLVDVGFMLELDMIDRNPGAVRDRDYFSISDRSTLSGRYFFLKYPKYDDDGFEDPAFFRQALNYIKDTVAAVHTAIDTGDMAAFENLCDKDSFLNYILVNEWMKNVDGAQLSMFFNKKMGGKFKMGPLWDFDLSSGDTHYPEYGINDLYYPENWWIVNKYSGSNIPWFRSLIRVNSFYEEFRARYLELYETNIQHTIDSIDVIRELIRPAALRNFNRWQILNSTWYWPQSPPVLAIHTWDGQIDYLKDYLTKRSAWMYDQLYNRKAIPGVR